MDNTDIKLMSDAESEALNAWCSEWADDNDDRDSVLGRLFVNGSGKRIPYIGWFWRDVDFTSGRGADIADCGDFIGICQNNKWGYDQRSLTDDEMGVLIDMLDQTHAAVEAGSDDADAKFAAVWDWFQTLVIPTAPWNI